MTWKDMLELGLKDNAAYRKDNLPSSQIRGPEFPSGPGRSPEIPMAREDTTHIAPADPPDDGGSREDDVRPPDGADAGRQNVATRDHEVIRQWAARRQATPGTGEATVSGPATVHVRDGGVGIRFNFPGTGRFRPITWDEWFEYFDRHQLAFVYEEDIADRAYAVWQARGSGHGHDRDDWFEAERQMTGPAGPPMGRYRFSGVIEVRRTRASAGIVTPSRLPTVTTLQHAQDHA